MIILSNAFSAKEDEGALKVATSLVKRVVQAEPESFVISFERESALSDLHLELNKLLVNRALFSEIRKRNEPVLYIPFPAKEWATALRVLILSLVAKRKLYILLVMTCKCGFLGRLLFRISGAKILTLSEENERLYADMVSADRVKYLRTGVDTERFHPVSADRVRVLKEKYGFDPDLPVVLHVGHMKSGRNIEMLLGLDECYQILLVTSTQFRDEQDTALRDRLLKAPNVRLIDTYLENIEEIYQLSDVYVFPVIEKGNCIDIPLSCLEAAACGTPVVTTRYGEMKAFEGKEGFFFIDSFERDCLNRTVKAALTQGSGIVREAVLEYDWSHAVSHIVDFK